MVVQARADVTRQLILDTAVQLFDELGYGKVALSDIIARAQVTKGACYYHFATKEALAAALIEDADNAMVAKAASATTPSGSAMENLIRSSFAMAELMVNDPRVRIGLQLGQALSQISHTALGPYSRERMLILVAAIEAGIAEGDLKRDLDAEAAAHAIWCAILGNYFLAEAAGENVVTGLAKIWRISLDGIASSQSASFLREVVDRASALHSTGARKTAAETFSGKSPE